MTAQQGKHQALLNSFDDDLERLRDTPLHPSLIATVGGSEAIYSIAHTGVNLMSVSTATDVQSQTQNTQNTLNTQNTQNLSSNLTSNLSSSPLSPSLMGSRVRGHSISDDIDSLSGRMSGMSGSTNRVSPVGLSISPMQGQKGSGGGLGLVSGAVSVGQQQTQQGQQQSLPQLQSQQQLGIQQQSQQGQQQRLLGVQPESQSRKKSFCLDTSPSLSGGNNTGMGGGGMGVGQLEVGSFDEAYPFQTGEVTINREDYNTDITDGYGLTLYDCVPAEKERAWAMQCGEVHLKVEEKLSQLLVVFRHVSLSLEDISVTPLDTVWVQNTIKSLEDNLQDQVSTLSFLSLRFSHTLSLSHPLSTVMLHLILPDKYVFFYFQSPPA